MQFKFSNGRNFFLANKNTLSDLSDPNGKINRLLLYSAFSLLFIGLRLWVIYKYGNATPFFDQWGGEGLGLYKPFVEGTLTWHNLLSPHNEHFIFIPRLLALTLFYFNKGWNPMLQMLVNVGIHLTFLLLLIKYFEKAIGRNYLPALLIFSLLLFGIPFAWENILVGFQSAIYLAFLFSLCALWLIVTNEPFCLRWWAGVVFGMLAFFSLASGAFSFAAATAVSAIFYITKQRKTKNQLVAIAVLAALFIVGVILTPRLPHQEVYKAHTWVDFYHAFKVVFGWPVGWDLISVVVRNLPIALFIFYIFKIRPAATDSKWFLFALCLWSVSQVALIAYARTAGVLAPRYKDLHAIPVIINLACLLLLIQSYTGNWRHFIRMAGIAWIVIVSVSICNNGLKYLPDELASKHDWDLRSEANTANFIATGDINHLKGKPDNSIPDSNPDLLASIIAQPGMKEILPTNISRPLKPVSISSQPEDAFMANGYKPKMVKQPESSWRSYTFARDTTVGQIVLQFHTDLKGRKIEIPVAGSALQDGIKLEIEENGKRKTLSVESGSETTWGAAYATITSGNFSIHITDSSTTAWVAVGTPFALGRLDLTTARLLAQYPILITIGIVLIIVLISLTGLRLSKTK